MLDAPAHAVGAERDRAEIPGRAGFMANMSSTVRPKNRAIVNARGSEGSYRPFSIKMTVWRDTPRDLASPA